MNSPEDIKPTLDAVDAQIRERTCPSFETKRVTPVAGGCINATHIISDRTTSYFLKLNNTHSLPMFEAEAQGLTELAAARALRVPSPVCHGKDGTYAWLVLEHLLSLGSRTRPDWEKLGHGMAMLHRQRQPQYGWYRNNTIGSTEQINTHSTDWVHFLRECRMRFQLDLAVGNGFGAQLRSRGERLLDGLDAFFSGYTPEASLLHGDLWSGNVGFLDSGEPVIFDPAVYFGDREADIAMSELFGGFRSDFYLAYESVFALDSGYQTRKHLYNLYHLLNHLNLFGQGYLSQCEATMDLLLAEI